MTPLDEATKIFAYPFEVIVIGPFTDGISTLLRLLASLAAVTDVK